jgi:DNA polymerase-2
VKARGFLLQPTYRVRANVPVVQLHGQLEDGAPFLLEDDRFRPYFFVHAERAAVLAKDRRVRVEPCELVDLAGRPLARVVAQIPGDVPRLRERVEAAGGEALEADVRFAYRYLIDHGLRGAIEIDGEAEERGRLRVFRNPVLGPASGVRPRLSVLSLDIETTPDASRVLSFALLGAGADEVHLLGKSAPPGAIAHAEERDLLRAFAERLRALDPDVLCGWNVVDFDLRVLDRRAGELGVPFELGRVEGRTGFQRDQSFTRSSRADVPGRMVLDGPALLRDAFIPLDDYSLATAAQTLLGRGKTLESAGMERAREIERLWREDPPAFVAYNRQDAALVLEILEREALLELAIERSLLSGMQLDRVGASIASFDLLYLPELRRRGRVAPSVDAERKSAPVVGGAVLDSTAGLYANVAVYDFKSLYPSLMRTFQLDPLAHVLSDPDPIVAPNGARFARSGAILPELLESFRARREEARRRGDRHADLAIKIMMNAMLGVLGAASCRFFDPEVFNAITSFGQQTLHWTRQAFEAAGARVLYGDTDSVFVTLDPGAPEAAALAEADALRARVEAAIAARIRDAYRVEPRLELELEKVYTRFFMPAVRGGTQGSKKRYAGLARGELELVGLESVRRDWPAVARRLQRGVLALVFEGKSPTPFVRDVVARVRRGELDAELVIRKGVRKGALERYTAAVPPHVQAARKAGGTADRVVRYVITTSSGPEPVLAGHPLPGPLDREHYVEKVLRPIADAILPHVGETFDAALGNPRQLSLL